MSAEPIQPKSKQARQVANTSVMTMRIYIISTNASLKENDLVIIIASTSILLEEKNYYKL